MRNYFRTGFSAAALLIAASCATNPVTGKREVMLVSEGQELAMGQQSDPAVTAQFGLYPDQKLQNFINEKGKQMGAVSHRPELAYNFRVVDSPIINAFAIPGGYVYFTRGIMAHFNNEAQFAGVLGHEIGHVTAGTRPGSKPTPSSGRWG
ncbi:M48 family metalloprotease [Hymenobacter busanensis]|uniref:M48 family metalloprotease n=1 Tax=Hymenobacter busanensis TaxID=2607656 RepID=UPI003B8496D7